MNATPALPLLIIGAGGHASVIIDAVRQQGRYTVVGVVDDRIRSASVLQCPVLGGRDVLDNLELPRRAVVAIGSPQIRQEWHERLVALGFQLPYVVHPSAIVGAEVELGAGTVLLPGAIVNARAEIGRGVIINTGASIDHDCRVDDFVHVAPGAHLAGGVRVGARSHIGIGASVIQNIEIGADAMIGAGAAVIRNVPSNCMAVGVPARIVRRRQPKPHAVEEALEAPFADPV